MVPDVTALWVFFGRHERIYPMNPDQHSCECDVERRRERRIAASWSVEFSRFGTEDRSGQAGVVIDLSREGLCLKTDNQLKTGMHLCIRMKELNCEGECKEEILFARMLSVAEVKWSRKTSDKKNSSYIAGFKYVVVDYW